MVQMLLSAQVTCTCQANNLPCCTHDWLVFPRDPSNVVQIRICLRVIRLSGELQLILVNLSAHLRMLP